MQTPRLMLGIAFCSGALVVASIAPARAGLFAIDGSYTAVVSPSGAGAPTINNAGAGSSYLDSPFVENLAVGTPTNIQNFLLVSPTSGSGVATGQIVVDFSLKDGSGATVTGVSASGGNPATLVGGAVQVAGDYAINYGPQTDCISWSGACKPPASAGAVTSALGDMLTIGFSDGAKLDVNLYNWSDWDMQPGISFDLVAGPTPPSVPEPASLALFAAALAGLGLLRRRPGLRVRSG